MRKKCEAFRPPAGEQSIFIYIHTSSQARERGRSVYEPTAHTHTHITLIFVLYSDNILMREEQTDNAASRRSNSGSNRNRTAAVILKLTRKKEKKIT